MAGPGDEGAGGPNGHNGSSNGGGNGGAPVAFGFSKTKQQRKVAVALQEKPEEKRQRITAFTSSGAVAAAGHEDELPSAKTYIVPKLENTFKAGVGNKPKGFVPTFRPPEHDAAVASGEGIDRFEVAQHDTRPQVEGYGLEKRARPAAEENGSAGAAAGAADDGRDSQPHQDAGGASYVNIAQLEQQAYKRDMDILPDAPEEEAYESMPIEEFGRAMLLGMGWKEGQGVGRNRKTVTPVEYLRRPERLGLGAAPAPPDPSTLKPKVVKMGDKPRERPEDLVLPVGPDGRVRHVRTLDEKLVRRADAEHWGAPRAGKRMRVAGGRHAGFDCVVVEVLPEERDRSARALVRLLPSEERVEVRVKDLQERDAPTQQPQPAGEREGARGERERGERDGGRRGGGGEEGGERQRRDGREGDGRGRREAEEEGRGRRGGGGGGRDDDDGGGGGGGGGGGKRRGDGAAEERVREGSKRSKHEHRRREEEEDDEEEEEEQQAKGPSWLAPLIKVRVVDKQAKQGRLYLKKGTVVDVHPGGLCDVSMDEGRETVTLRQSQLETVIPKEVGSAVLVVAGAHRGAKARLHAKSSGGACAVQLAHDFSVQRLLLDQVAAYVGSLDED